MTDIKILYDKIYSDRIQKDPRIFINIYEENKNLIEGADPSISNPDYDGIMRITAEYALSLSQYGSSRKSIPYLDKAIQLFKNSSQTDLSRLQMHLVPAGRSLQQLRVLNQLGINIREGRHEGWECGYGGSHAGRNVLTKCKNICVG